MVPSKRILREQALANQISRLERRINQLELISRRYSWLRLGIVFLGGLGTWLAAARLGSAWGWWTFFIFLAIFLAVALLHRRLEGWIERFKIWRAIKLTKQARMRLDWEHLSEPFKILERNSLDIDLDLLSDLLLLTIKIV